MLTITYSHTSPWGTTDRGPIELPITITRPCIEILRSDCCEPIIQPSITDNDLRVLRWALNELTDEEWLDLDEEVIH